MVLGFAEDLNAFPFSSGLGVYPGSGFAGADEAYTDDIGMLNEQAHVIRGAGDHIQDARGNPASIHSSVKRRADCGAALAALSTKVFPAARHRGIIQP